MKNKEQGGECPLSEVLGFVQGSRTFSCCPAGATIWESWTFTPGFKRNATEQV